ncbi:MAG: hypothetical protein ACRYGF_07590 [Janthinobacterium lividum]
MNVTHASQATSSQPTASGTPKLATAAKQFESVLLGQWLQDAESSFASVPGGDEDSDSGGQQMQGFATQQLATSLTAHGGIGIAKLVQNALARASEREQSGASAGHAAGSSAADAGNAVRTAGSAASAMAAYTAEGKR